MEFLLCNPVQEMYTNVLVTWTQKESNTIIRLFCSELWISFLPAPYPQPLFLVHFPIFSKNCPDFVHFPQFHLGLILWCICYFSPSTELHKRYPNSQDCIWLPTHIAQMSDCYVFSVILLTILSIIKLNLLSDTGTILNTISLVPLAVY